MNILKQLKDNQDSLISNTLNLGGTVLIIVGVAALPVHVSYRLIVMGVCMILMWRAYSK